MDLRPRIYLDEPNITTKQWSRYMAIIVGQDPSTRSDLVGRFEEELAKAVDISPGLVVATNSGTAALHLAVRACNVMSSMLQLPAFTFMSPVNVARYEGLEIIFNDVDRNTWTLTAGYYAGVVVPVWLYGVPTLDVGGEAVVVDACESLGGVGLGPIPNFVAYSFNGNKVVTTGGGGAVTCYLSCDVEEIRGWASQGSIPQGSQGYNYRMPGLNAALGLVQLQYLDRYLRAKQDHHSEYVSHLSDLINFQQCPDGCTATWWMTAGTFPEHVEVPTLQKKLKERGVPTRRVFRPFGTREEFPNAWYIYDHGLCLPSSTRNCLDGVRWVCRQVREVVESW